MLPKVAWILHTVFPQNITNPTLFIKNKYVKTLLKWLFYTLITILSIKDESSLKKEKLGVEYTMYKLFFSF